MSRHCGECSLCCKLMAISELEKPAGKWCQWCNISSGCAIHPALKILPNPSRPAFPPSCASFNCLWLTTPELDAELRPDRCGAVLYPHGAILHVIVRPENRDCWERNKALRAVLERVHQIMDIVILAGNARKLIPKEGAGALPVIREEM